MSVTDLASAIAGLGDYDAIDRFVTFVEQLDVAADLVQADTLPKARMALVAVDNLADLLLHRHAEHVFSASERSWCHEHRRFTRVERERILGDFRSSLKIAGQRWDMAWEQIEVVVPLTTCRSCALGAATGTLSTTKIATTPR
jgi:hypothetical protein